MLDTTALSQLMGIGLPSHNSHHNLRHFFYLPRTSDTTYELYKLTLTHLRQALQPSLGFKGLAVTTFTGGSMLGARTSGSCRPSEQFINLILSGVYQLQAGCLTALLLVLVYLQCLCKSLAARLADTPAQGCMLQHPCTLTELLVIAHIASLAG